MPKCVQVEPLNFMIEVSDSPYGHKMSVYVLLKSDKLGISLYVLKTHPVYSVEVCVPRITLVALGVSLHVVNIHPLYPVFKN